VAKGRQRLSVGVNNERPVDDEPIELQRGSGDPAGGFFDQDRL
jgi:hypothetical protein